MLQHTEFSAANETELRSWGTTALSSGQVSASHMTFPKSCARMRVAAFLMSQIERTKLIKSPAFKQQPRGREDVRKALAVRQAARRALRNREQQQMRVVGLSASISQFQHDSTHTLPGRSRTLHQKVTFAKCSRGCFISTGFSWAKSSSALWHCGVSEVCIRRAAVRIGIFFRLYIGAHDVKDEDPTASTSVFAYPHC